MSIEKIIIINAFSIEMATHTCHIYVKFDAVAEPHIFLGLSIIYFLIEKLHSLAW